MTVTEFIKRKNKKIRDNLNIEFDLVPENQIEEVQQFKLSIDGGDSYCCPYCMAYEYKDTCGECIMFKHGNYCCDAGSTYDRIADSIGCETFVKRIGKPLTDLIEQYNSELK